MAYTGLAEEVETVKVCHEWLGGGVGITRSEDPRGQLHLNSLEDSFVLTPDPTLERGLDADHTIVIILVLKYRYKSALGFNVMHTLK